MLVSNGVCCVSNELAEILAKDAFALVWNVEPAINAVEKVVKESITRYVQLQY